MTDARDILSKATGIAKADIDDIWVEVKANHARLKSCAKHQYEGGQIKKLGAKYACKNCGGTRGLEHIGDYIDGYVAAGGNSEDIWPGWK